MKAVIPQRMPWSMAEIQSATEKPGSSAARIPFLGCGRCQLKVILRGRGRNAPGCIDSTDLHAGHRNVHRHTERLSARLALSEHFERATDNDRRFRHQDSARRMAPVFRTPNCSGSTTPAPAKGWCGLLGKSGNARPPALSRREAADGVADAGEKFAGGDVVH